MPKARTDTTRGRRVARSITLKYLMVLGVLAVLSLVGYVTFLGVTVVNEGSAAEVNLAGRQRMLSQRIAFYSWRLLHSASVVERKEARWELRNAIELMEKSHRALIEGNPGMGLPGDPSEELRAMYFGPEMFIDRDLKDYLAEARKLVEAPAEDLQLKHRHPVLQRVSRMAPDLLRQLDAAVKQYQQESERRAVLLTRIGTAGLVLTLLILLLAGLMVFAPLARQVRREVEELDSTRERLSLAMQGTDEGLWDWDIDADRAYLSPRLRTLFGIDESQPVVNGKDWVAFIHPEDRRDYLAALIDHLRGRTKFFVSEYRLRGGEGDFRWVRQRGLALRNAEGHCYRMAGSVGDVTRRKHSEEELRLAASVFANSPQAIMITDAGNRIRDVNPAFSRVTGYTREEVLDRDPGLLASGRHDAAFFAEMWRQLSAEDHWAGEVWNRRKNGEIFPEHLEITALRDDAGEVVNYIAQFTDITQAKRDQEQLAANARQLAEKNVELEEAVVRANEANRAKSEFLAAMSHELRTPLNAVIGFAEAMLAEVFGPVGDARYGNYLRNIRESGRHLLDVINDILDVSKVEAGRIELNEEPTELSGCIEAALRLIRGRAENEGIAVETRLNEPLPALMADERRIKQVLINLLSNAVKFTDPGGRVELRVEADREDGLTVTIEDTGIGISETDLEKVMTPFTQVDGQLARKYEGTGLGLPLTKGLVEAHGGMLSMESTLGRGTRVTVWLPPERLVYEAAYDI